MSMNDNKAIPENLVVVRWHYKFTWNIYNIFDFTHFAYKVSKIAEIIASIL